MNSKTDKQLINYIRIRSQPALEELISRYRSKCTRTVTRYGDKNFGEDDVTEVLQDIWLSIWKYAASFNGDSAVSSWIYRITVNATLMKVRKNTRKTVLRNSCPIDLVAPSLVCDRTLPDSQVSSMQSLCQLSTAIKKIPNPQSRLILINNLAGCSTKENQALLAQKKINLSYPAIKSQLYRAKNLLKEMGIENII